MQNYLHNFLLHLRILFFVILFFVIIVIGCAVESIRWIMTWFLKILRPDHVSETL